MSRARSQTEANRLGTARYFRTAKGRYTRLKYVAKERGLELTISLSQLEELLSRPCHWCGEGLDETGCGLDRLDSRFGYTRLNVVSCCGRCNQAKNDLTVDEFIGLVRRVYERHCAR